jgi:hypothetical protein
MLFCRCHISPYQCEPFLRSASLGQGVVLNHRVFLLPQMSLFLSSVQNFVIEFETQVVIKFNF